MTTRKLNLTVLADDEKDLAYDTERLFTILEHALEGEELPPCSLTVNFVSPETSKTLHEDHFNDSSITDVMTFPDGTQDPESEIMHLGDLAVCPAVAQERVTTGKGQNSIQEEVELYCLHGLLHILGYDDHDPEDRIDMWQRQKEVLAPYFPLQSHGDEEAL